MQDMLLKQQLWLLLLLFRLLLFYLPLPLLVPASVQKLWYTVPSFRLPAFCQNNNFKITPENIISDVCKDFDRVDVGVGGHDIPTSHPANPDCCCLHSVLLNHRGVYQEAGLGDLEQQNTYHASFG